VGQESVQSDSKVGPQAVEYAISVAISPWMEVKIGHNLRVHGLNHKVIAMNGPSLSSWIVAAEAVPQAFVPSNGSDANTIRGGTVARPVAPSPPR